jgi:hypothetical protein
LDNRLESESISFNQLFKGANMFFKNVLKCTLALLIATPLHAFADSINIKVGAWEMTTTTLMTGVMIPVEAQANMSPEQRAKIEEIIQARSSKPNVHIAKTCVTKEDLDQDRILNSDYENQCKKKIISKSASRIVLEQTCEAPGPSKSTVVIEANTSESIAATMDMMQAGGSGKVHVDIKGQWLGASCEGIEKGD